MMSSASKNIDLTKRYAFAREENRRRRSKMWRLSTQLDAGSIVYVDHEAPGAQKVKFVIRKK